MTVSSCSSSILYLAAARLHPVQHYIDRRHTAIAHAIANCVTLEECRGVERRRGPPTHLYQWDQPLEPVKEEGNEGGGNPVSHRSLGLCAT